MIHFCTYTMNWTDKIRVTNEDNMELMKRYPDKYFDLAIVDPPYGIGWDGDNLEDYNSTSCDSWKGRKPKGYKKQLIVTGKQEVE